MPNSHLIAPATGDRVHLISAATGQVEWESADIGASTTPVVGPGGIAASLFVGSTDGWIYRLRSPAACRSPSFRCGIRDLTIVFAGLLTTMTCCTSPPATACTPSM